MGKDARNCCTLQSGKGTETLSNSFSTLVRTFRLQPATKGPYYITLRLESLKMCSNFFGKLVSIPLGKDCFWDDSVRLHFLIHNGWYPRKRLRQRPSNGHEVWNMMPRCGFLFRTTPFADSLPHPQSLISNSLARGRFNRDVFFTGCRKRQRRTKHDP